MKAKFLYCLFFVLFLYSFSGFCYRSNNITLTANQSASVSVPSGQIYLHFVHSPHWGQLLFGPGNTCCYSIDTYFYNDGDAFDLSPNVQGIGSVQYSTGDLSKVITFYFSDSPFDSPPVWDANPISYTYTPGGVSFSQNLNDVCTGATSYSSSNKPAWLSLSGSMLTGTVATTPGTYNFTVTATNSGGSTNCSFSIVVGGGSAPVWHFNPVRANFNPGGVPYSLDLDEACTGATSYSSSNKPAWLSISGHMLTGTVTTVPGTYNFLVSASNDNGVSNSNFIFVVGEGQKPVKNVALFFDAYKGSNFSIDLASCFSYATSYTLGTGKPSWLTLVVSTMSGSCPVTETAQNYIFDVTATNQYGSVTYPCCININDIVQPDALKITSPAAARTGKQFSYTPTTNKSGAVITVTGLPSGLSYANGVVSGTIPDGVSTFTFTVHASKPEYADTSLVVYGKYDATMNTTTPPTTTNTSDPNYVDHVIVDNPNDMKTDVSKLEAGLSQTNSTLSRVAATADGTKSAIDNLTAAINNMKASYETNNTTNNTTTNNNLGDIKTDLTHVIQNQEEQITGINGIKDMLSAGLDDTVDPNEGYTKEVLKVVPGDFGMLVTFQNILSPKGKTPPPVKIPLSALNENLPSFIGSNFSDYNVDFSQPPISILFVAVRLCETILMTIAVLILAFKAVRTFEF